MRATMTIAWRDFRTLVTSPMFAVITAICTSVWTYQYIRSIMHFAQMSSLPAQFKQGRVMNIHYDVFVNHIGLVNFICIVAIPAITMRLLSEEKKQGTYDLLLTSPITATNIALGKFLGGFGVTLVLLLVALIYPLGTLAFTDYNLGPLLSSFLGLGLIMGIYVAVGLFASSLTRSQVLSVILGVLFNLILWLMSQGAEKSDNPFISSLLQQIHLPEQFRTFLMGTLNTSAVVFFLSAICLFIFLTQRVVESSRWR